MAYIGIIIYLFDLYIRPQDWISFMKDIPVDYIIMPLTIFWGLMSMKENHNRLISLPQYMFLFFFLMSVILSNVIHGNYNAAYDQFIFFLKKILIFFMFLTVINSYVRMERTLLIIVILSTILAVQGIYQHIYGVGWAGQPLYWDGERITWIGFWNGSNILALGFVTALPIAMEFAFSIFGNFFRFVGICSLALLSYGLWLCNSRGGILSAISVIFLFCLFRKGMKRGLIIAVVIILFLIPFMPSRSDMLNTKDESAKGREWLWEQGYHMLKQNPIFGVGKGQFTQYSDKNLVAHSNYVQNMAEMGLVGFFFWIGLLYFSVKGLYNLQKKLSTVDDNNNEEKAFNNSLVRILIIMLGAFYVGTIFITSEVDPFYMLLGLSAAMMNIGKNIVKDINFSFSINDAGKILAISVGWIALIYLYAVKEILR